MKSTLLILIAVTFSFININCKTAATESNAVNINFASLHQQTKTIESVVSSSYVSPLTTINNSPAEAVNLIVDALNQWAAIKCSHTIDASLGAKWQETKTKYIGVIAPGSTVEFLVLVNRFTCKVIGMVHKTQTVRVKDNVCSIDDIKLESPDLIYDPDQTGFFSIKIKF